MPLDPSRRDALLFPFLARSLCVQAQAAETVQSGVVLPESLRRGFNLPDQAPLRAEHVPNQNTLRTLRELGMTHVRLPVVAEYVLPQFSGPATVASALDDVDRSLQRLLSLGYAVSVDLHADSEFSALQQRDPGSAHRALLAGWPQIAKRISRWPVDRVFVELLNEPATDDDIWRPFVEKLAQTVRAVLPTSYIIVGPAPFQRIEALVNWRPLADSRIVYACHFYDPMLFTHQGSSWDTSTPWGRASGVPFPSAASDPTLLQLARKAELASDAALAGELRSLARQAWNHSTIAAQFAALGSWSARYGAPVVVNEFGVLKWKAKRADRLNWLASARVAIEEQGFGWAHWDYGAGFGLLDDAGAIDQGIVQSLLTARAAAGPSARSAAPRDMAAKPMMKGRDSGTK